LPDVAGSPCVMQTRKLRRGRSRVNQPATRAAHARGPPGVAPGPHRALAYPPMDLLLVLPVLLLSVVLHEYAHGWMALRQGDRTALDAGRLTLNPIVHIDPVGSIIVPLLLWL